MGREGNFSHEYFQLGRFHAVPRLQKIPNIFGLARALFFSFLFLEEGEHRPSTLFPPLLTPTEIKLAQRGFWEVENIPINLRRGATIGGSEMEMVVFQEHSRTEENQDRKNIFN